MKYLWLALLVCIGCMQNSSGIQVTVSEREDYSLPAWVTPDPFTGYGSSNPGGRITQRNWSLTWRELEPRRGEYNWALVEDAMREARDGGYQLQMHLHSNVVDGGWPAQNITCRNVVPDWVFEVYNPPTDTLSWLFNLRVIPAWREDINAAFNTLIQEFGKQGYPQRDELGAAYIHGVSLSRGEEFWMEEHTAERVKKTLGFTREACTNWIKTRINAYAEAFTGVTHKLVWVGHSTSFNYGDWEGMAWELVQYGWSKGCGTRDGIVERFHTKAINQSFGASVDSQGYMLVDETIPPIATVRYFGEENEEYGERIMWRYGTLEGNPFRYRMAMLRSLQMRLRFLWTNDVAEEINPPLSEYARLSFGKTVATTPDAWAYLKESPVTFEPGVVKNFERWLLQRDLPGGMTVPTHRLDREYDATASPEGQWYDYAARRTDLASGNPYMYFNLDDRFKTDGTVDIRVEYLDISNCRWNVEYNGLDGVATPTPWVENRHDGRRRTVTFRLSDARFGNRLEHAQDFRIVCDGPEDLTVTWVRVLRHRLPE